LENTARGKLYSSVNDSHRALCAQSDNAVFACAGFFFPVKHSSAAIELLKLSINALTYNKR